MRIRIIALIVCIVFLFSSCKDNTESDKTTEQPKEKITENTEEKAMTKKEEDYYKDATVYIQKISQDMDLFSSVFHTETKGEQWIKDLKKIANRMIDNGEILRDLEYTEEAKKIGTLVQGFGVTTSDAYQKFIDGVENSDKKKLEEWQFVLEGVTSYYNEINYYSEYGFTISEGLEQDLKKAFEDSFESIYVLSGTNQLSVILKVEYNEDKMVLKNNCLQKVQETMQLLSQKESYHYFDVTVAIQSSLSEGNFKAVQAVFSAKKRSQLDFDNISVDRIPVKADFYSERLL